MAARIVGQILTGEFDSGEREFMTWFLHLFEKTDPKACTIEEFAVHFLGLIRSQTEDFTKGAPSVCDTPGTVLLETTATASSRKPSITSPADALSVSVASAVATTETTKRKTSQLLTASGCLKVNTGGIFATDDSRKSSTSSPGEEAFAGGSRSQTARSISRDLFVGSNRSSAEDDFSADFRAIEHDHNPAVTVAGSGRGCTAQNESVNDSPIMKTPNINFPSSRRSDTARKGSGRNENEKNQFTSIEDAPFSPIPAARRSTQDTGKLNSPADSSTPVRSAKTVPHQLNTSTPIISSGNRSSKGSRNSWGLDCSTPNKQMATGNSSRHDSRRSHDRSFASNNSNTNGNRQGSSSCLGDFITHSSLKSKTRKSTMNSTAGNVSNCRDTSKTNSFFSENDFPGLGVSCQSPNPKSEQQQHNRSKKRVTPITVSRTLTSRLGPSNFELDHADGLVEDKPKRRVVPISLNRSITNRHDFNTSSFKSDNNLIDLTEDSLEQDLGQKDERGLLRNYKHIIKSNFDTAGEQSSDPSKALRSALRQSSVASRALPESGHAQPIRIDLKRVTQTAAINRLVEIYSLLIDLNLTPNVLSEIAYLINLINTEYDPFDSASKSSSTEPQQNDNDVNNLLKNLNNCIYFAMEVLNRQKAILAAFDSVTLKVLIENERIASLNLPLHGYLKEIHAQKLQLDSSSKRMHEGSFTMANGGNVLYQQEADTREHFPSEKEFGAFKKQRDAFCTIYRTWDFKHLNPTWNFLAELSGKIRSLLAIMEHPINMAHLAKLFTAQLVQSCNYDNSPSELAEALPNVDPAKLVKLRQRLVAPSQFSTQYLFPGNQAFFRDFILASESNQIFIEQLKAVLIHELLEMNGSSYEVFNVTGSENQHDCEYVARAESTTTMRVLAKFIGFIISRPFNYDGCRNSTVDNRQIELRNRLLPLLDVKSILLKAIAERKLIITVPWLVQYLAMLDGVTLRLDYYKELFDVLYELYLRTSAYESGSERKLLVTPMSKFIIRVCLGWLFEHPNIPEVYYSYRQERKSQLSVDEGLHSYAKFELLVDNALSEDFTTSKNLVLTKIKGRDEEGTFSCDVKPLEEKSLDIRTLVQQSGFHPKSDDISLNPILESILNAACPFLADFRVSMMPSKLEKSVSRSGRYRHITTKYAGATALTSNQKATNDQYKLLEAFLQSQSLSVRRTIEFVIERASSAAIKDFQVSQILPQKRNITDQIASVQAQSVAKTTQQINSICSVGLADINAMWDAQIPPMLTRRIKEGFDALLPSETLEPVKRTCINLALERCLVKTNEWRQMYMLELDLFCKNIPAEAVKATKNDSSKQITTSPLTVRLDRTPQHTTAFEQLQNLVHSAASYPDELNQGQLGQFLTLIRRYLDEQGGTHAMNKTLAFMVLQLALLLVINRCDLIVPEIVQSLLAVWKHRKLIEFCEIPEALSEDAEQQEIDKLIMSDTSADGERSILCEEDILRIRRKKQQTEANYIFSTLVSNRAIRMMAARNTDEVFACFANLINSLVDSKLISIRLLNEQFVKIFNENWEQRTLERLSRLMDAVRRGSSLPGNSFVEGHLAQGHRQPNANDTHSQLFLEMLSDLAREIEDF
ncbi:protein disks lost isoform X3 [Toxorhynchites rutilus septentrionalis]|uniref:protein disks lost isoform X3 n=1 Tax=Toxorhynchites rutilus septentrionalis TaxID=329112 RepID=UPI0024785F0E|nr:protein disks lost isoform X3 [Toxorhynchites rutilus septentrionalis]